MPLSIHNLEGETETEKEEKEALEKAFKDSEKKKYFTFLDSLRVVLDAEAGGSLGGGNEAANKGVRLVYGGDYLTQSQISEALWSDMRFAVISFILVFLYSTWHTMSPMLSLLGLLQILLTFPTSLFFYQLLLVDDVKLGVR